MALGDQASAAYQNSKGNNVCPGTLKARAATRLKEQEKEKKKKQDGKYRLRGQPRAGSYTLTQINSYRTRKCASLTEHSVAIYQEKVAGGPGSGVQDDNTLPILELPMSKLISIGKRKAFMDAHKPESKSTEISLSDIKYVCQKNMVPKKVLKMLQKKEVLDYPIDVLKDSDGNYHVMDGHHRFLACMHAGRKKIKANVWCAKPLEKKAYTLNPKHFQFKPPATVTAGGIEKKLAPKLRGTHRVPQGMPKLKPMFNNEQYLRQHFADNPFLG